MTAYADRIAICADDLRLEMKQALRRAQALGFAAVDVGATTGEVSPRELSRSGRRHLLRYLSDLGLRLASLRGPATGGGYADANAGDMRVETMCSVISLAADLRVPVVSTALGPTPDTATAGARVREALTIMANEADRYGVRVGIETAGITAEALHGLLADLNCPWLGAACDPGAMLMLGENPHRIADHLAGRISIVRARDAIAGTPAAVGRETAWGAGNLDVAAFLAGLHESGFDGDFVMTRTESASPDVELREARTQLASMLH